MGTQSNHLIVINQTIGRIETKISQNQLLGKIMKASEEDIFFLNEQYGEEAVDMGIGIIKAYTSLYQLVVRLQNIN